MAEEFKNKSTDELKHEADRIQDDVGATADAIREKLKPRNMFDDAVSGVRSDGVSGMFDRVVGAFRDHPLPMMAAGVALAAVFGRSSSRDRYESRGTYEYGYGYDTSSEPSLKDKATGKAEEVSDRARGKAEEVSSRARGKAEEVSSRARGKVEDISGRVRSRGEGTRESARYRIEQGRDYLFDHPLVLAAAGLAVGASIGGALPATSKEKELAHKSEDKVRNQAMGKVEEVRDAVKDTLQTTKDEIKDSMINSVTSAKDDLKRSASG